MAFAGSLSLAGCSTLENGAMEDIYVSSEPSGALVTVSTSDSSCTSPCAILAPRGQDVIIGVEKKGYAKQMVTVSARSTTAGATVSHDVTIDYLGRVIDSREGAETIHVPNPLTVVLKPGT